MIQGWIGKNPSQTSVTLLCRVGPMTAAEAGEILGTTVSSSQVDIPNGANNGGSGYTLTFAPAGYSSQEETGINLDNNATDGFFEFTITGLSAGDQVTGTLSIDTGAGVLTSRTFTLKTLPLGQSRKAYFSCASYPYDTSAFLEADRYTFLDLARKIIELKSDYCSVIDDLLYMSSGHNWTTQLPWSPPKNVASTTPHTVNTSSTVSYSDILATDFDRSTATDSELAFLHAIAATFCNPAIQYIGQRIPMDFREGDHDFMPGNNADHDGSVAGGSIADEVTVRQIARAHWQNSFGHTLSTDSYASAPSTAVYPSALGGTPATYGAVADDYLPNHWVIQSDYVDDFVPDFLSHRSPAGDDTGGATLLGATQATDLQAELAASSKSFLSISSAKQFFVGITNNTDSYVGKLPNNPFNPSASTERNTLVTAFQGLDQAVSIFSGDAHTMQNASLDGIAEFNIAPFARWADNRHTAVQQEVDASGNITTLDDLFNDSGMASVYSGQFDSWMLGAVRAESDIGYVGNGFGYSRWTERRAYHTALDNFGCVVGGITEMIPNTHSLFSSSAIITETEVGIMADLYFVAYAITDSANYTGFGINASSDTLGAWNGLFVQGESGSGPTSNDNYCAVLAICDKDTAGMGAGLNVFFNGDLFNGGATLTASGGSFPDTCAEWPSGLEIVISDLDGSNATTLNASTVWDGTIDAGSTPYTDYMRLYRATEHNFVDQTYYLIKMTVPNNELGIASSGGGGGVVSSVIQPLVE